jgi:hypothetical protein
LSIKHPNQVFSNDEDDPVEVIFNVYKKKDKNSETHRKSVELPNNDKN